MKILSLSTHHYADGGLGKVFESTKHFKSLNGKAESNTIEVTKTSDIIKQRQRKQDASILLVWCVWCLKLWSVVTLIVLDSAATLLKIPLTTQNQELFIFL